MGIYLFLADPKMPLSLLLSLFLPQIPNIISYGGAIIMSFTPVEMLLDRFYRYLIF